MRKLLLIPILLLLAFPVRPAGAAWWTDNLTLSIPFSDPDNPLTLTVGTGSLSFTRATTATYVHPTTGLVTSAASGQLRIESNGALIEGARTNIITYSRTLNNAAWTLTNATADNTITGEDGVASSASWLAASGSNGTACQSVTIGSAAYSGAFSLKRITGTGTVKISLDNGATYGSDLAGSLSANAWYRASKSNQTLANPEICLQLGTSGDNVAVDYAQIEAGAFISSRIPTTTVAVTRNRDDLTFPASANFSKDLGTLSATVTYGVNTSNGQIFDSSAPSADQEDGNWIYHNGSSTLYYNGRRAGVPSFSITITTALSQQDKLAATWSTDRAQLARDGELAIQDTSVTVGSATPTSITLGNTAGNSNYAPFYGYIKDSRVWNRAFLDNELQSIAGDMDADAFTFTDVTGATFSTVYTSNSVNVAGITAITDISITGGTYSINGGAYTSAAGVVALNDNVAVRATSSGSFSTATNAVLTIGGVSDTYTVTTRYGIPGRFPEQPTMPTFPTWH